MLIIGESSTTSVLLSYLGYQICWKLGFSLSKNITEKDIRFAQTKILIFPLIGKLVQLHQGEGRELR